MPDQPAAPPDDFTQAERLLATALRYGTGVLEDLARRAVTRLAQQGTGAALKAERMWTHAELAELAEALASVQAMADLLGRARVRIRQEAVQTRGE